MPLSRGVRGISTWVICSRRTLGIPVGRLWGSRPVAQRPSRGGVISSPLHPFYSSFSEGNFAKTKTNSNDSETKRKSGWIPVGLGAGLLALALTEYRHIKQRQEEEHQLARDIVIQGPLWLHLYTRLPLRYLSQLWGYLNNDLVVPRWARKPLFGLYSWAFNCQLGEALEEDLEQYENLGKFFYRALKPGMRPLGSTELISPSDGKVLHLGSVALGADMIEQVKGVNFSVTAFLGETPPPAPSSATQKNLQYVVVYLAPGDYHRFHSPTAWSINELRHFPGQMYSVSPALVSVFKDLFVLNERAVLLGNWAHGFFAMAPVAATNVGNIHLNFQPDLVTNVADQKPVTHMVGQYSKTLYPSPLPMTPGEEMGGFKLGSTVILLFEAPEDFEFTVKPGETVRMGQAFGGRSKA